MALLYRPMAVLHKLMLEIIRVAAMLAESLAKLSLTVPTAT